MLDTKLIHINLLHFYILNNERSERGIKEAIPFSITSKRIKYLGINLLEEAKDMHSTNYKVMKDIEDDTNSWKNIPYSWTGRINIVKMTILPKAVYGSVVFFRDLVQNIFNLYGSTKDPE